MDHQLDQEAIVVNKFFVGVVAAVLVALSLALVACGSGTGLPKGVVARVGTVDITQDQFEKELAIMKGIYSSNVPDEASNPAGYKQFEAIVMNSMIEYQVAQQKAAELGVTVSDQDAQDYLDTMKKNSFGGDEAKLEAALKADNLTVDQLKFYYTQQILVQRLAEAVTNDTAAPTEAELSAYYDAHKTDFNQEETRTARHILVAPVTAETPASASASTTTSIAATEAEWAAALAKAQQVRADLVGGADWKAEAAQYSDDPGSKDSGGELGTVKKGVMVPEFEQAVYSLAKDEISQPVKTVYGYHIIQVTGITPAKQLTLDEAKATIESGLLKQKKNQAWRDWMATTRAALGVLVTPGLETTTTTAPAGVAPTTTAS